VQPSNGILTATDFKNWLSVNNTIVCCPLITPEYLPLNDTLQEELNIIEELLSYQGQTNISQESNDLPFIISATTLKDISSL
jgi:hypothetical protein